jgi:hypothetical protein
MTREGDFRICCGEDATKTEKERTHKRGLKVVALKVVVHLGC